MTATEQATIEDTVQELFEGGFKAKDFRKFSIFNKIRDDEKVNALLEILSEGYNGEKLDPYTSQYNACYTHGEIHDKLAVKYPDLEFSHHTYMDIWSELSRIGLISHDENAHDNTPEGLSITRLGIIYVAGDY